MNNVGVGEYNLAVETFYGDSSNVTTFDISVIEGEIEEVVEEVVEEPVNMNMYLLYGVIIFVTLITLAALIFLFIKSRDGNGEEEFGDFEGGDFGASGGGADF